MYSVPLRAYPNQRLQFVADGATWLLHVYQTAENMAVDIYRDGNPLVIGYRCAAMPVLLIPFDHLWKPGFGNFMFDSEPDWQKFGGTCNLYYMSQSEIEVIQGVIDYGNY